MTQKNLRRAFAPVIRKNMEIENNQILKKRSRKPSKNWQQKNPPKWERKMGKAEREEERAKEGRKAKLTTTKQPATLTTATTTIPIPIPIPILQQLVLMVSLWPYHKMTQPWLQQGRVYKKNLQFAIGCKQCKVNTFSAKINFTVHFLHFGYLILQVWGHPCGPRLLGCGPSDLLDNVLHALLALRPCDPRNSTMMR